MPPPLDPKYTLPQHGVEVRDVYTKPDALPTWGGSVTPHSAAFDAFHQPSTYSTLTTLPSNHGIKPQQPIIPQVSQGLLPCEFKNLSGCDMVFQFLEVDQWIEHMINEHLVACFPTYSICWFCDVATFDGSSSGAAGRSQLYRQRMHHIATHFYAGKIAAEIRPDFFFLDHLHENNLINEETFQRAKRRGELPDMLHARSKGISCVYDERGEASDPKHEEVTVTRSRGQGRSYRRRASDIAFEGLHTSPDDRFTGGLIPTVGASKDTNQSEASFEYNATGRLLLGDKPFHPSTELYSLEGDGFGDDTPSGSSEDSCITIDISEYITADIRVLFLDRLLEEFAKLGQPAGLICCNTGSGDSQNPQPSASLTQQQNYHNSRKRRTTNAEQKKKKDDDDDDVQEGPRQKPRLGSPGKAPGRLLACPFFKWKPHTYRQCHTKVLKEISRMKSHLWRCHETPIHCDICFMEFSNKVDRATHIRQRNCELCEPKTWECISDDQRARIKRRVDTKKTKEEQWFEIYAILFRGHPAPDSPYIEGYLSENILALQDFMALQWPPIFNQIVDERLPVELRNHEDVVRGFLNSLFEEAANRIVQRCETSQTAAGTSDSGYNSRSSNGDSSVQAVDQAGPAMEESDTPSRVLLEDQTHLPLDWTSGNFSWDPSWEDGEFFTNELFSNE
ncbi:hypothetical protein QQS21_003598 [Conoideocrella luteorostrata]|uniref:C2H2-type domain-containing protein n=1 Tax=Conoideocrella luteorostrata TaxID=1105319 RepID=A0AAJ0FVF0_9HYPO|nr:hypothetical protein QQS21_003598 [Conoideocrella luteorostrata]